MPGFFTITLGVSGRIGDAGIRAVTALGHQRAQCAQLAFAAGWSPARSWGHTGGWESEF